MHLQRELILGIKQLDQDGKPGGLRGAETEKFLAIRPAPEFVQGLARLLFRDCASGRSTSSQVSPIFFSSGSFRPNRSARFLPPQIRSWGNGSNSQIAMIKI